MLPLILVGLAAAAVLEGCTEDEADIQPSMESNDSSSNYDSGRDGYASDYLDAVSQDEAEGSDVASQDVQDVAAKDFVKEQVDEFAGDVVDTFTDIQQNVDTFVADFKDMAGGDELEDTGTNPFVPTAPEATYVADMPCAFPASLSVDVDENSIFATCDGGLFKLFKGFAPQWESAGAVPGFPSNHAALGDGHYVITHAAPDGFTIVNGTTGEVLDSFDLSTEEILFSNCAGGYVPNNPSGAVLVGDNICVATSNIEHADMDQLKTTFYQGNFVCVDYLGSGKIAHDSATAYPTSGLNPTGMMVLGGNKFAVLSTNGYDLTIGTQAYLDVCEWPSMQCEPIELTDFEGGPITAQISPRLAQTADGIVHVAAQKPISQLLSIDVEAKEVVEWMETSEVKGFLSSVSADGDELITGDFGVWGEGGKMMFTGPTCSWNILETATEGYPGPSTSSGGTFYVAITGPEMSDAALYSFDKSSLTGE